MNQSEPINDLISRYQGPLAEAKTLVELRTTDTINGLAQEIQNRLLPGWTLVKMIWDGNHEYNDEGGTDFYSHDWTLVFQNPVGQEIEGGFGYRDELLEYEEGIGGELLTLEEGETADEYLAETYGIPSEHVLREEIAPIFQAMIGVIPNEEIYPMERFFAVTPQPAN